MKQAPRGFALQQKIVVDEAHTRSRLALSIG
jgi:hypothetical protein